MATELVPRRLLKQVTGVTNLLAAASDGPSNEHSQRTCSLTYDGDTGLTMKRELAIEFSRVTEAAALAGYNAGPGRAINWLELSGGDPDLFMATITIDSTRLYIQRIYGYYTIYRTLYGVD